MKIQHPLVIKAVGSTAAALVWQLGRTLKYHFRYKDPVVDPEVARTTGQRVYLCLLPRSHALPRLLLELARDAHPDQRASRRRADHAGRETTGFQRRPRLDHPRGRPRAAGDEPAHRSGPPVRHARRPPRASTLRPSGRRLSRQPHRLADRGRRHGVQEDRGEPRAGTASACPDRSARPRASFPKPSSFPTTPTATPSKRAARKSSAACRPPRSKRKPGSKSFEAASSLSPRTSIHSTQDPAVMREHYFSI